VIPPGSYPFRDICTSYNLGLQRLVSDRVNVARGSFYDGTRFDVSYFGRTDFGSQFAI
jgi:hypothetical protein